MVDVSVMFGPGDQEIASSLARELKRADIDAALVPGAGPIRDTSADAAGRLLVLWSEASANSNEIFEAASAAMARGRLVNLKISRVATPRTFAASPSFDLTEWRTYRGAGALTELLGLLTPRSAPPCFPCLRVASRRPALSEAGGTIAAKTLHSGRRGCTTTPAVIGACTPRPVV